MVGMLLILSIFSFAQVQLTGKVTDAKDGSALPGVTVKVKNSNVGTITDATGTYHLSVPSKATTIVFSFIGFADQEVAIAGQSTINAALQSGNKDLSEVIVVGYGTLAKRDLTGSVTKISAKEIENQPISTFETALQGKAPGVVIESGSGKVGQAMKIRIRGTSSISAESQPLYVVDGVPIVSAPQGDVNNDPTNPLADINPNDIESVEVLKDASASAIYGARAANGVVLITTKRGKGNDKTNVDLNLSTGWAKPTKLRGFLDAKEYVELVLEAASNDGKYAFAHQDPANPRWTTEQQAIDYYQNRMKNNLKSLSGGNDDWQTYKTNTNWEKLAYRDQAHTNQADLSISGGNAKTRFYASGTYSDQEAIVIVNRFKRYGGRLNLEHTANEKLSFGLNLGVSRTELTRVSTDNAFSTPGQMVAQPPITKPYDANGEPVYKPLYYNALVEAKYAKDLQVTFRTIGNAYLNYNFIPSLSFRSEIGADIYNLTDESFLGKETQDARGIGKGSSIFDQNATINTNNYFTFNPQLGTDHSLSLVAGMSYLQNRYNGNWVTGEDYPTNAIKNVSGAVNITGGSSNVQDYAFLSYFFRANYNYKKKYIASFSLRSDGSSRFGPDKRYGLFPAGSLGWVLSEEDFLKDSKWVNYLKLRASYGLTGNAEIGNNKYLTLLQVNNYPGLPGLNAFQLGDPRLHWENTSQVDVGLEFGFFDNRLSGEVDYYNKQTTDLLLRANQPLTSGYPYLYTNVGKMENKGVEIMLSSKNIVGKDFNWSTTLNLAYNKNKVKEINGQVVESSDRLQRAVEGQPIGVFYMPKYAGVDPDNGDELFYDASGKKTNDYTQAEYQVVGKSNPDWTGGLTNTFTYKGFDLNIFFSFVEGNNIYNLAGQYQSIGFANGLDNQTKDQLNRWQKKGDITDVPRVAYYTGEAHAPSSRWLYDGSYIRLKNVTLGYSIPKSVLSHIKLNGLRVYVAGYNLWTKTKYISDPEVNTYTQGNIGGGVDFYTVPQAKTITVGLNVKF
ncbi:SusC/RagA family TonB-linked outer membrane protein [Chitinophaga terrae (ex Kim and Jung 2007)]|nr:SusC/RagA family TonB-linked outer membrane protein [Chitinophaga terrae (ex Kim and Jung 2007)]